jgi:hypothetical protein
VENYGTAGQATDDYHTAHALGLPDKFDYKHTHSEYVIFIDFPLQQWLHENASMLRNTYTVLSCLSE